MEPVWAADAVGRHMNIGQLRRHFEDIPDNGIVVFQQHAVEGFLSFPAMAATFTKKQIRLPDGEKSTLAIIGLSPDHRDCQWLTLKEPDALYKMDGFYINIINRRLFEGLPDEGLVRFFPHHESGLPISANFFSASFFPAIGVFAYASNIILPDGKESTGLVVSLLPNDRDYPAPADLANPKSLQS